MADAFQSDVAGALDGPFIIQFEQQRAGTSRRIPDYLYKQDASPSRATEEAMNALRLG